MTLGAYLLVALMVVYLDAVTSIVTSHRFNLPASAALALVWPITLPIAVIWAAYLTRRF